jgi:thiol-disulfide isomerase/thioredoxin
MTRSFLPAALAAAALLSFPPAARAQEGLAVGTRAPVVSLPTVAGDTLDLADYVGKKPVLIEFWATWCPLCKELEPAMRAAHEQFGKDVAFIHITVPQNQTPERARRYAEEHKPGVVAFDANSAAIGAFRVPHTSYVVVIDRTGTIVYTGVGGKQDIAAALAKVPPAGGMEQMD